MRSGTVAVVFVTGEPEPPQFQHRHSVGQMTHHRTTDRSAGGLKCKVVIRSTPVTRNAEEQELAGGISLRRPEGQRGGEAPCRQCCLPGCPRWGGGLRPSCLHLSGPWRWAALGRAWPRAAALQLRPALQELTAGGCLPTPRPAAGPHSALMVGSVQLRIGVCLTDIHVPPRAPLSPCRDPGLWAQLRDSPRVPAVPASPRTASGWLLSPRPSRLRALGSG